MKIRGGLQRNLTLGYLVVVLAVVAGPHALLGELVTRRAEERLLTDLERAGRVVLLELESAPDPGRLQDLVERLAGPLETRITLIGDTGQVLADSAVDRTRIALLPNHAHRPEVQQTLAASSQKAHARRTSETTGRPMLYRALPGVGRARALGVAVVRTAADLSETNEALASLRSAIGWSASGALGLGLLLALLLSRRITRGVDEITRLVAAIQQGDALPEATARWGELTSLDRTLRQLGADIARQRPEIRRDRAHLLALLESSSQPILVVAPDGSIAEVNPAARAAFQLVEQEQVRRIGELGREPLRVAFAAALATGLEQRAETGDPAHPWARLHPIPGAFAPQGVVVWLEQAPA